jgi:hypothetical protein
VNFWLVTKDYFSATGIPLLAGRAFDARDDTNAPAVAIINEALAKRYFPNEDAIGKVIRIPDSKKGRPGMARQIIGVVGSVRQHGLREPAVPVLYVHYTDFATGSIALAVRTKENPVAVLPAMRAAIQKVNPELVMTRVSTAEQIVARSFAGPAVCHAADVRVCRARNAAGRSRIVRRAHLRGESADARRLASAWRSAPNAETCSEWFCAREWCSSRWELWLA